MRRRFLSLTLVLAALAGISMPGLAAYPDKPIRLIVPSATGGAPDALMRVLATQLSQQMGVPFVVDNKPGGAYLMTATRWPTATSFPWPPTGRCWPGFRTTWRRT